MSQATSSAPLLFVLLVAAAACAAIDSERSPSASMVASPLTTLESSAYEFAGSVPLGPAEPESHPELHNVYRLSSNVISGSEPEGEEAFRILRDKGVRTILSVDGKEPDAAMAERYGMRYVHVPIRYRGITPDELAKISKTFREREAPFYVHCFHGKHRGPAAAEIGRLILDGVSRETAMAEMRQWCGTSPAYEGLYQTVGLADLPTEAETRALDWDFPSASPLEGVAGAMVRIARSYDLIKALSGNDWTAPSHHPDANAANEAFQLAALLERTGELDEMAQEDEDFQRQMTDAARLAADLRDKLRGLPRGTVTADEATTSFTAVSQSCTACHELYRN